jgi:hypothetical protein
MLNFNYTVYVVVMYVLFSVVILTLVGVVVLAWCLRTNNEQSKGLKMLTKVLQVSSDVFFIVFFMILAGEGPSRGAWRGEEGWPSVTHNSTTLPYILPPTLLPDYFTSFWSCDYTTSPIMHNYWTEIECFGTPHLINAIVALIGLFISMPMTVAIQTATCVLNPVAKGVMASSDARNKVKVGDQG